jgi:hypothetical protein
VVVVVAVVVVVVVVVMVVVVDGRVIDAISNGVSICKYRTYRKKQALEGGVRESSGVKRRADRKGEEATEESRH